MVQEKKQPAFKVKFGRWSGVVWEKQRENGAIMMTGKISRVRKINERFKEEFTFFSSERQDYLWAFEAIDHYTTERLQNLKFSADMSKHEQK